MKDQIKNVQVSPTEVTWLLVRSAHSGKPESTTNESHLVTSQAEGDKFAAELKAKSEVVE